MKKNIFTIAIVMALISIAAVGCKSSKGPISVTDGKKLGIPEEIEITFPCSGIDSDEEFLRVTGIGKSKDRTMAKDLSYQAALSNLASKLAGVMAMGNQRVAVSVNADGEEFHAKTVAVSKLIAKANVAGYRVACEKFTVTPQTAAYNCYVAIEFGKQKVVKELYEALNNEKLLKADYDFDRYMKAFEKDLEEYEKANK